LPLRFWLTASYPGNMSAWVCGGCGFKNGPKNWQCGGTGPMGCNAPNPDGSTDPWAGKDGGGKGKADPWAAKAGAGKGKAADPWGAAAAWGGAAAWDPWGMGKGKADPWGAAAWDPWSAAAWGKAAKGGGKDKGWGADPWAKGGGDWGKGGKGGKGKEQGGKGKDAQSRGKGGEIIYQGAVKQFDAEKQRGYVVVDSIRQSTGQDVYAHASVLQEGGVGVGETAAFFVHWNDKGMPQASKPMFRIGCVDEAYALKGTFKPGNNDKGFGFVVCETAKAYFGRDIYCAADKAGELTEGQWVAFNIYLNRDGQPNVSNCAACEEDWEPTVPDFSESAVSEAVKAKGDAKGGKKGGGGGGGGPPEPTGDTCVGLLKQFNATTNYGFIDCDDVKAVYDCDTWVHGKLLEGIPVGSTVQFELGLSAAGKPQAMNVVLAEPAAEGQPPAKKLKKAVKGGDNDFEQQAAAFLAEF